MLNFGNKEFRNLQEQVGKNQDDILKLKQSLGGALPDPIEGPEGPEGPQGEVGPQGERGTGLFGTSENLPSATAYKEGDMYLLNSGLVYKKVNHKWLLQTDLKGPQGLIGPVGTNVVANPVGEPQDDLTTIEIDGVVYEIQPPLSPETLSEVLEGSETVVVDENLEGDKLQVRLDQYVVNKLDRALVTPLVTPTEKVLVGVDTGNSQIQVKIGTGLELQGVTSPYTLVSTGETPENVALLDEDNDFTGENTFNRLNAYRSTLINPRVKDFVNLEIENEDNNVCGILLNNNKAGSSQGGDIAYTSDALIAWSEVDIGDGVEHTGDIYLYNIADKTAANTWTGVQTFNEQIVAPNTFNVINASDLDLTQISGDIIDLTQTQYDLITNGKPTIITGVLSTQYRDLVLLGITLNTSETDWGGKLFYSNQYAGQFFTGFRITVSSKRLSLNKNGIYLSYNGANVDIPSLTKLNGKNIPAYPSNTGTFVLKCVDGTLTWVAE